MIHRTLFARRYRCRAPGYWVSDDGFVLREEMRGDRNARQWFVFQVSPERAAQGDCPEPHESLRDLGPVLSFYEAGRLVWQAAPFRYTLSPAERAELDLLTRIVEQRPANRSEGLRQLELRCLAGLVPA